MAEIDWTCFWKLPAGCRYLVNGGLKFTLHYCTYTYPIMPTLGAFALSNCTYSRKLKKMSLNEMGVRPVQLLKSDMI